MSTERPATQPPSPESESSHSAYSAELLAAQARLLALRASQQTDPSDSAARTLPRREAHKATKSALAAVSALPPHLGWESAPVTAHLNQARERQADLPAQPPNPSPDAWWTTPLEAATAVAPATPVSIPPTSATPLLSLDSSIRIFPALATAIRHHQSAPSARLWLLLKALDAPGSGWVWAQTARDWFTDKKTPFYLSGWRRLRQILHAGQGLYWHWDGAKIWLRAPEYLAVQLGVTRFTGRPVFIKIADILGRISHFNRQLYATFHTGRAPEGDWGNPIARETIATETGCSPSSQRRYEQGVKLSVEENFAIGDPITPLNQQQTAYEQGTAYFVFHDVKGVHGPKGVQYNAWQLPNSYGACQPHAPRGRQNRANRQLKVLSTQGMTGNSKPRKAQVYFDDVKQMGRTINPQGCRNVYWSTKAVRRRRGRRFWYRYRAD